jgi:hexosaminidase
MGNITPIIPAPARFRAAAGEFRLGWGATIGYRGPMLATLAQRFGQDLGRRCGIPLQAVPLGDGGRAPEIVIDLGDDPDFAGLPAPLGLDPDGPLRDERYALTVDRSGIKLRGREPAGVARGLTSLLQLIATATATASATATATASTTATATASTTAVPLPALDILDAPRFAWRGLTVDVVRRFFPPAQIRTLIDVAALTASTSAGSSRPPGPWASARWAGRSRSAPAPIPGTSSSTGWTPPASGSGEKPRSRPRSRRA